MAKRKQQNIEIEKKIKSRRRMFSIVAVAIVAIVAVATAIGIWTVQDARWVLRYDGGRVAATDFSAVWMLHGEGQPWAREASLESLKQIVVIRDRAIQHGVDFTPEERTNAEEMMASWRQQMEWDNGWDIIHHTSNARMAELFHTIPVADRLMDIYEPTYTIDEEAFAEMFEQYIEHNLEGHKDMEIHAIILMDYDTINEVYAQLGEVPFEDMMRQYMPWIEEDEILVPDQLTGPTGLLPALDQMGISPDDRQHLLDLQAGEYSRIVDVMNFDTGELVYVIIQVLSRDDEIDLAEVEAELRENMILEGRNEAFIARVETWVEEANFEINQRGYDRV